MRKFVQNSVIVRNVRETLQDQPTAVKVVVLLTLAAIVLAAVALITGLLAGATAAVFLTAPLVAPKTRRDYFDELPEPYRTQAFENTRKDWEADGHDAEEIRVALSLPCTGLEDALKGAFVFGETPEGRRYWNRAANGLFDAPQFPEDTTERTYSKIERILWIALILLVLFGFFYMVGNTVELVLSLAAAPLATRDRLQKAVDDINQRIDQGKNIDDQLAQLVELDRETKGLSFKPLWDSYEVVTDVEKLAWAFEAHGPEGYKEFKNLLIVKGGPDYAHRTINKLPWHTHAEVFKLKI